MSTKCCGERKRNTWSRGLATIFFAEAPKVVSIHSRVPHSAGDFTPAGGGRYLPMVLNIWPMKPSGVQLASPMRPPDLHTRCISEAVLLWSGENIAPNVETTAS